LPSPCNLQSEACWKTITSVLPDNIRMRFKNGGYHQFHCGDDAPEPALEAMPRFHGRQNVASPPTNQQPQPMQSNSALLRRKMTVPWTAEQFSGVPTTEEGFSNKCRRDSQQGGYRPNPTGSRACQIFLLVDIMPKSANALNAYAQSGPLPCSDWDGRYGCSIEQPAEPDARSVGLVNAPASGLPYRLCNLDDASAIGTRYLPHLVSGNAVIHGQLQR